MSIPSALGQMGQEMPAKSWSKLSLKGKGLQNKDCCLPSSSTRIKSLATAVADLQDTLKGIQNKGKDEALCALGKWAELAFSELDIFRRNFLRTWILASFYTYKSTKTIN